MCVYICACVYVCVCACVRMHVYVFVCVRMCVCVCVCVRERQMVHVCSYVYYCARSLRVDVCLTRPPSGRGGTVESCSFHRRRLTRSSVSDHLHATHKIIKSQFQNRPPNPHPSPPSPSFLPSLCGVSSMQYIHTHTRTHNHICKHTHAQSH
jgi:hypothetical protein